MRGRSPKAEESTPEALPLLIWPPEQQPPSRPRGARITVAAATGYPADWSLVRTLRAREHVEGDRNVFARHRRDSEHMKQLVVPEDLRAWVGTAPRIHESADRIEDPAGGDEQDGHRGEHQQLREDDGSDPAERQTNRGRQPLRRLHPAQLQ